MNIRSVLGEDLHLAGLGNQHQLAAAIGILDKGDRLVAKQFEKVSVIDYRVFPFTTYCFRFLGGLVLGTGSAGDVWAIVC